MKPNVIVTLGLALGLAALSSGALAVPVVLDSSFQCSAGNQAHGIATSDVTGNRGGANDGANDCWGAFDGNDPGPSGMGFEMDGMQYDFVAKQEEGKREGMDIGLSVEGIGFTSGTWEYDPTKFDPTEFLIVLKAANSPGYGAWLFDGAAADSFSGDWLVAWEEDLSHLAVYEKVGGEDGGVPPGSLPVPEPGPLALMGGGLLAFLATRRRRAVA